MQMEVRDLRIEDIVISEYNIRKDLEAGTEDASITDLAESIRDKGLLNPIIVRKLPNGTYDLVAGQRRFLAIKKLGWSTVSAIIRDFEDDTDAAVISLIENVHRADLNPIDKAKAYRMIYDKYQNYSLVAKETGVSTQTIRKYISLLDLAPSLQSRVGTKEGTAGIDTLSKLSTLFSSDDQEKVLESIGGFKQSIQLEILKRSEGKVELLDELTEEALEGAFEPNICKGIHSCSYIPEELRIGIMNYVDDYNKRVKDRLCT